LSLAKARWARATLFVLVFLLGVSPWLVRNKLVSGAFLGMAPQIALNGDDPMLDNTHERSLHPELKRGVVFAQLRASAVRNLLDYYGNDARTLGDGLLIGLFLATLFYRFAKDDAHRARWGIILSMVLFLAVGAVMGRATMRLFHIFLPVVLIYGAAFFFILLDRLQLRLPLQRYAVIAALVLLTSVPLILTLMLPRASIPYPPYYAPYISHICRMLAEDEVLCTDIPWATAWYGNRNSLGLPRTIDDFYEIHFKTRLISGIYFRVGRKRSGSGSSVASSR
jgi:hypothetical protein